MEDFRPGLADDASAMADLDDVNASALGHPRPRRHDDEDEGSDIFEGDDLESTLGAPVNGHQHGERSVDEEKELPAHACAYVYFFGLYSCYIY
jgi:regulator of nonsense transcripts 1